MCKLTGCMKLALEARFMRHTKRLPNGCLIWTGGQSTGGFQAKGKFKSRGGPYGSFKVGKDSEGIDHGTRRAHVVFAFLNGLIPTLRVPEGFHLDHGCESGTLCVSCIVLVPDHVNLKLRHERPHCRAKAAAVTQEVREERRARLARTRRSQASKRGHRLSGNPAKHRAAADPA